MTLGSSPSLFSRTIADDLVERLENAIMTGEIAGGSKLSEVALASMFKVSRAPIREAIRRLEGRKLVQRTPFVGAHVIELSARDILEIFVIREALEGMAARIAAEVLSDAEIAELRAVVDPHACSDLVNAATYQRSPDLDFHYRIAAASKSARLIQILCGDLYYLMRMFRFRATQEPGRLATGIQEHRAIVDAIAARDAHKAEALMRKHLRAGRAALLKTMPSVDAVGDKASAAEDRAPLGHERRRKRAASEVDG